MPILETAWNWGAYRKQYTHKADILLSAANKSHTLKMIFQKRLAGRPTLESPAINTLVNRKNLARTQENLENSAAKLFLNIETTSCVLLMPGYGYARVSKKSVKMGADDWGISSTSRETRAGCRALLDSSWPERRWCANVWISNITFRPSSSVISR